MEGKRMLITGATGAIGGAVAKSLAERGANLVLLARDPQQLDNFIAGELESKGHTSYFMDLNELEGIGATIKNLAKEVGPFDGFVHAAGIGEVRPLKLTSPSFMMKVMNVNFFSFVEIVRAITAKNVRRESLNIVGVSATGAFLGNATKTAYCASKSAMNSAVRCLAKELADKGVRINTVAPGATHSKMMDEILSLPGGDESLKKITERQFLGVCQPEDIADAVVFLLSDSSKMISGSCLPVDGGKLVV